MFKCPSCKRVIGNKMKACPYCHTNLISDKRILPALLLCLFFPVLGFHRFYVGKVGTGFLYLLTLGCFGIWFVIDLVLIIIGAFEDSQNRKIELWT